MNKATSILSALSTVFSALALFYVYRQGFALGGPAAMGIWALASGIFAFARFGDSGMGVAVMRQVSLARQNAQERPSTAPHLVAGLLIATTPVAVIGALLAFPTVGYLNANHSGYQVSGETTAAIVWFSLIYAASNSAAAIFSGVLDGIKKISTRNLISLVSNISFVASSAFIPKSLGIISFCYSNLILSIAQISLSALVIFIDNRGTRATPRDYTSSLVSSKEYLTKSVAIGAARAGFEPVCKFLVGQFGGLAAVALFDLANRISIQVRQITSSMMQPLSTVAARDTATLSDDSAQTMWKWTEINFAVSGLAASAQILASPIICWLILKHQEAAFYQFSIVLAIGGFINSLGIVAFFSDMAGGMLGRLIKIHLIMLAINVAGGLSLGFLLGSLGVSISWAAALSYGGLVMLYRFSLENPRSEAESRKLKHVFAATAFVVAFCSAVLTSASHALVRNLDHLLAPWIFASALIGLTSALVLGIIVFGRDTINLQRYMGRSRGRG